MNDVYTFWTVGAPSLLLPLVVNLIWMGDSACLNHSRVDKRKGQNMASWTPCPKCGGHVPGRGAWEFPSCLIAGLQHCIYARLVKCSATNNCKAESGGGGRGKWEGACLVCANQQADPSVPFVNFFKPYSITLKYSHIPHNAQFCCHICMRKFAVWDLKIMFDIEVAHFCGERHFCMIKLCL